MKYSFLLLTIMSSFFCLTEATPKKLYRYDAGDDCVKNQEIENPSYGAPDWSYQKSNREESLARALRFKQSDIVDKSIMEFGCNDGGVLFSCRTLGASKVIGIEYNEHCIKRAEESTQQMGISRANFYLGDMENKAFLANLPQVDTVLLLAILDTSEFFNKTAVIANLSRFAKQAMYYEGHMTQDSHVPRMYDFLIATDFTRFEYLGRFQDRILMRFSRKMMKEKNLPRGAITTDCSDEKLLNAEEIYVFTDSLRNPPFSKKCRLIQFVRRGR
jgi:predicted nicotinamide N-methyase